VIEALSNLSHALAALPGRKSLLYVGEGFAMRPGEDVFGLLSTVFESDRRFGDRSVVAGGASSGGGADAGNGSTGGQGTSGGAVVSFAPRTASPMLQHGMAGLDLTAEVEALAAAANGERVTFYAISSAQPEGVGSRAEVGRGARIAAGPTSNDSPSGLSVYESSRIEVLLEGLDSTASTTGGLAAAPGASVGDFLERVWERSSSYYSLAYPVPHPEEPGERRIKVKVSRKGVRVRHREAYVVKPRAARIGDLLAGALLLRTGENPHRLDAGLAGEEAGADGTYSVSLGLRIPIGELALLPAGDALRAELEVYVLSMDQRGRLSEVQFAPLAFAIPADRLEEARDRRFVATFPLVLEPGSHALAVGLAERGVDRFSVARTTLEIGGVD
jgi:VWFA-related protein